jgi:hypothetical protein
MELFVFRRFYRIPLKNSRNCGVHSSLDMATSLFLFFRAKDLYTRSDPCKDLFARSPRPPVLWKIATSITIILFSSPILLRAGSRRQASLRKTDAVGVRENPSSGPAKSGQPLRKWIRIHSSRLFPSRSTRPCSCFSFSFY